MSAIAHRHTSTAAEYLHCAIRVAIVLEPPQGDAVPRASRPSAADRGYDSRWQAYRRRFLRENPFCRMCWERKVHTPATVVDHIKPHKGDKRLFWDPANHQGLCRTCHDGPKKAMELSGTVRGCDENGVPLDPGHHWGQG